MVRAAGWCLRIGGFRYSDGAAGLLHSNEGHAYYDQTAFDEVCEKPDGSGQVRSYSIMKWGHRFLAKAS